MTCDTLIPVAGMSVDLFQSAIDHEDIDVTIGIINGKLHSIKEARIRTIEITSEMASGKLTGRWEFQGGKPSTT